MALDRVAGVASGGRWLGLWADANTASDRETAGADLHLSCDRRGAALPGLLPIQPAEVNPSSADPCGDLLPQGSTEENETVSSKGRDENANQRLTPRWRSLAVSNSSLLGSPSSSSAPNLFPSGGDRAVSGTGGRNARPALFRGRGRRGRLGLFAPDWFHEVLP